MRTFDQVLMNVVSWGYQRKIIENGKPLTQSIKTLEEVTELISAINRKDDAEIKDAVGDVMVTLAMICAQLDIDMVDCFAGAYEVIKDRKGYLRADGMFIKEQ